MVSAGHVGGTRGTGIAGFGLSLHNISSTFLPVMDI